MSVAYSVLDLAPVVAGGSIAQSYRNMADLARRAEAWGYTRYWLAEHHAHPGVASAATVVLIEHVLSRTKTIRVGSGGIMLPNHAPLIIAEQFGTLETLHPGRVDLGLGRAPGTDPRTAAALRRHMTPAHDHFPRDVVELMEYFRPQPDPQFGHIPVRALPGEGLNIPIYILGSSLFGAELAALLGVPFAFASHFAPEHLIEALALYRNKFRPSDAHPAPYAIAALNVIAADDRAEANFLVTSLQQSFLNLGRGNLQRMEPPVADISRLASAAELAGLRGKLAGTIVGDREDIAHGITAFLARTQANELILNAPIFNHEARCRSLEIASEEISKFG
jgi:luciferase family oxidoreductase group 1